MTPLMQFIIAKYKNLATCSTRTKKKKVLQGIGQITLYTAKMPYPANGMS